MSLIDRYIVRTILLHCGYALAGLTSVFTVMTLTRELRTATRPGWSVGQALWFVGMTLPSEAYAMLPPAALLGTVLAIGRMAAEGELVALQASGASPFRIVRATMLAAGALAVVGVGLAETVAAPLHQRALTRRALALSSGQAVSTTSGLWLRSTRGFVNVGALSGDGTLDDLYFFDLDDRRRLTRFAHARHAVPRGDRWQLQEVRESRFTGDRATHRRNAAAPWDTNVDPAHMRALWLEPRHLSIAELQRTIGVLRAQGQRPLAHEVALWRRISAPVYMSVMMLLALPLVTVTGRSVRLGERATLGALAGIGFHLLQEMLTNVGIVAGSPPALTALFPALLAATGVAVLFRWRSA